MSSFRVLQIDHVEMFVPDRDEAAAWYQRILGLTVVEDFKAWAAHPRGPLMISSDDGSTKLALFAGEPQGERPTAGFHLVAFRVDGEGFLAFSARLSSLQLTDHQGRTVTGAMAVDHGKAWSLYFNDPWGHRLELTTYDYQHVADAFAGEQG